MIISILRKHKTPVVKGIDKAHLLAWANMHDKKDVYNAMVKFEAYPVSVNGKDLLAMGYRAGPQLGKMLNDLQDKWMKSGYKLDKEELLKKVPVQESIVIEAVARFMTGHGITYKGKKYDEMEVEVVAVDNEKRQYQVMILSTKELLGTNVMMSARFMHRGTKLKQRYPIIWEQCLDEDFEKLLEDETPDVYVDMDGVLVDFFNEWARLVGVKSYRDISKRDIPKALKKIVDTIQTFGKT